MAGMVEVQGCSFTTMVATGIAGGPCCAHTELVNKAPAIKPKLKARKVKTRAQDACGMQLSKFDAATLTYRYRSAHCTVA
jgi:hypothetical protein